MTPPNQTGNLLLLFLKRRTELALTRELSLSPLNVGVLCYIICCLYNYELLGIFQVLRHVGGAMPEFCNLFWQQFVEFSSHFFVVLAQIYWNFLQVANQPSFESFRKCCSEMGSLCCVSLILIMGNTIPFFSKIKCKLQIKHSCNVSRRN